jgi:hypothetical protein
MTPEGKVKKDISAYLSTLQSPTSGVECFYRMPVRTGYGKQQLDYYGSINGLFFVIEAKAPGEWLTSQQRDTALEVLAGGGKLFIISRQEGLDAFKRWVDRCCALGIAVRVANYSLGQRKTTPSSTGTSSP